MNTGGTVRINHYGYVFDGERAIVINADDAEAWVVILHSKSGHGGMRAVYPLRNLEPIDA